MIRYIRYCDISTTQHRMSIVGYADISMSHVVGVSYSRRIFLDIAHATHFRCRGDIDMLQYLTPLVRAQGKPANQAWGIPMVSTRFRQIFALFAQLIVSNARLNTVFLIISQPCIVYFIKVPTSLASTLLFKPFLFGILKIVSNNTTRLQRPSRLGSFCPCDFIDKKD